MLLYGDQLRCALCRRKFRLGHTLVRLARAASVIGVFRTRLSLVLLRPPLRSCYGPRLARAVRFCRCAAALAAPTPPAATTFALLFLTIFGGRAL